MAIFQLRLPDHHNVWQLEQGLIDEVREVLARQPAGCCLRTYQVQDIEDVVRGMLRESVRLYGPCGELPRCHEGLPPGRCGEMIYVLDLPDRASGLIDEMESRLFDRWGDRLPSTVWLLLKGSLDRTIWSELGRYLYRMPQCDNCPRCTTETQLNPWVMPAGHGNNV